MIDPLFKSDNFPLARKLLDASVLRGDAIAANIANAETPGYRRVDLAPDFARQLSSIVESGASPDALNHLKPSLVQDQFARSMRPDGNTVDVEHELVEMNKNTVDYDYLTEIVSHDIRQLKMAITGQAT